VRALLWTRMSAAFHPTVLLLQIQDQSGVEGIAAKAFSVNGETACQSRIDFKPDNKLPGGGRGLERFRRNRGIDEITVRAGFVEVPIAFLGVPGKDATVIGGVIGQFELADGMAPDADTDRAGKPDRIGHRI